MSRKKAYRNSTPAPSGSPKPEQDDGANIRTQEAIRVLVKNKKMLLEKNKQKRSESQRKRDEKSTCDVKVSGSHDKRKIKKSITSLNIEFVSYL